MNMAWDKKGKSKKKTVELNKDSFFKRADTFVHTQGLKTMAWGEAEVGKTFFGLSGEPPIYAIGTEFGIGPVLRHFPDKEIYVYEAAILDESTDEPDIEASLKNLEVAISTLKDVDRGTILIDSGTDIWGWLGAWVEQQARKAGKMTSAGTPQRLQWGRANLRWRQLILRLMAKPVHFIITAQVSEEYNDKGQPTGVYRPRIQRQTAHMCDVILHLEKTFTKARPPKPQYMATLTKCRFQRGVDMQLPNVTWQTLTEALKEKLGVEVKGSEVK